MIARDRLTACMDGEFVVFLIGMRINQPLRIDKWLPVARAMPRMLRELYRQPQRGFLSAQMWFARTIIVVQYWRSLPQLMDYASARDAEHLPAWRDFNHAIGTNGAVGIWHETYTIAPGQHESIYVNMPAFGLGRAGTLVPATGSRQRALDRLHASGPAL